MPGIISQVDSAKVDSEELEYDVFIAGSGPIAATYARLILEHQQTARIVMVEAGIRKILMHSVGTLGDIYPGLHWKLMQALAHIIRGALQPVSLPPLSGYMPTLQGDGRTQRESRSSVNSACNPDQDPSTNMETSAVTRTVGGMATHWTCACPEPHDEELELSPLERDIMRHLLQHAKKLLNVHDDQFEHSVRHQLIKKAVLESSVPQGRAVKSIPLAGERSKVNPEYITWSGANTILGDSISAKDTQGTNRLKLIPECLLVKLIVGENEVGKVTGALVRTLRNGEEMIIRAKTYVVACGAVCTPQILWNSNIRHQALGRYLTGQSGAFCQIVLRRTLIDTLREKKANLADDSPDTLPIPLNDPDPQITIPYSTNYPYHIQIHRDAFSYGDIGQQVDHRVVVDIRHFGKMDVSASNYVSFSDKDRNGHTNTDVYGMPQPTFHFQRSSEDEKRAQVMMKDMCDIANILGTYLPTAPPQFIPPGFHLTGTTRLGKDPQTSVADKNSRVRVDEHALFSNLWIGGCNCIPDSTACNPTLTAVAYAIQGADDLVQVLGGKGICEKPSN